MITHLHASRSIVLSSEANAVIRTAEHCGDEHIVVPVVMLLGDSVIHPVNAPDGPELVLASELMKFPDGWNGRQIVVDHPSEGTANTPEFLESSAFGIVLNAYYDDISNKLKGEAWLSRSRAARIANSHYALDVIRRVEAHEIVELSTGVGVLLENKPGIHKGARYMSIWRELVPDHLAMLPSHKTGACPVAAGCGGPRYNSAKEAAVADVSDEAVVEGTIEGEVEKVIDSTTSQATEAAAAPCACHSHNEGGTMSDKEKIKALATRLISCEGSVFTETNRPTLEALGEDALVALADKMAPEKKEGVEGAPAVADTATPTPVVVANAAVTPPAVPQLTPEQLTAVTRLLAAAENDTAYRKKVLVRQLSKAQKNLSAEQLEQRSLEALTDMASVLDLESAPDGPIDFSIRANSAIDQLDEPKPLPDMFKAGVEARAARIANRNKR